MKLILILIMSSVIFAQTSTPSIPAGDTKVFGLELGANFTLPECHKTKYGKNQWLYDIGQKEWCYQTDRFSAGTHFRIYYPFSESPSMVSGLFMMGRVLNGKIEGLSFNTSGAGSQETVLKALTDKYGKPTSLQTTEVQNGFGAKFPRIIAHWEFPNLFVDFEGVATQLDSGLVVIYTPTAKAAADAEMKAISSGKPL